MITISDGDAGPLCQERGLPDPWLPGHQDQAAARVAPSSLDGLAEHRQLVAALDQVARRVGARLNRGTRDDSPILHPFGPVFNQVVDALAGAGNKSGRTAFPLLVGS